MEDPEEGKKNQENPTSPEQLDQLMHVTSPKGWLAVAALTILLAAILGWAVLGNLPTTVTSQAIIVRKGRVHRISAQQGGIVKEISVNYYQSVEAHQVVARIQPDPSSPKLVDIEALYPGIVAKKLAQEGDFVATGATILTLEPSDPTLQVIAYMPLLQAKAVRAGMTVQVSPSTAPREVNGFLWGKVRRVAEFPSEDTNMLDTLGNDELVKYFLNGGTASQVVPLEILVDLVPNRNTPTGYSWSTGSGPAFRLSGETLAIATFVLGDQRPISLLIPDVSQ